MTDEEFESAIAEALDAMPEQFMEALQNVAVVWEEEPSAYHLGYDEEWGAEGEDEFDDLLGLFDGLSIVERANGATTTISPTSSPSSRAPTSAVLAVARKSWKKSARPSSMSWATTSALTRISWPPWATSRESSRTHLLNRQMLREALSPEPQRR